MSRSPRTPPSDDPEAAAHVQISRALAGLDEASLQRTVRWIVEKYHKAGAATKHVSPVVPSVSDILNPRPETGDLPSFFQRCNPQTQGEKVLVAAYHHQEIQGTKEWDSRRVNADLKQMGHKVPKIVDIIQRLADRSPALVIQTKKDGSTRQGRKKYRLTSEGVAEVQNLLAKTGSAA